jgi:hypothetical protein
MQAWNDSARPALGGALRLDECRAPAAARASGRPAGAAAVAAEAIPTI